MEELATTRDKLPLYQKTYGAIQRGHLKGKSCANATCADIMSCLGFSQAGFPPGDLAPCHHQCDTQVSRCCLSIARF
jgi:hypothetical protein